ncbi:hypothetical protein SDC9_145622 [bioreactor metagenome]|uniref:Uncharacterized protein n=1 Tax=bioreactor metagenome TaxID=1076179 RepID=A0A645E9Y9_9ZZZZ
MLTEKQINDIEARWKAATVGPWEVTQSVDKGEIGQPFGETHAITSTPLENEEIRRCAAGEDVEIKADIIFQHSNYIKFGELKGELEFDPPKEADLDFLANSWQDIKDLIETVKILQDKLDRIQKWVVK